MINAICFYREENESGFRIVIWLLCRIEHERNGNMVAACDGSAVGGAEGVGAGGGVIEHFENGAG